MGREDLPPPAPGLIFPVQKMGHAYHCKLCNAALLVHLRESPVGFKRPRIPSKMVNFVQTASSRQRPCSWKYAPPCRFFEANESWGEGEDLGRGRGQVPKRWTNYFNDVHGRQTWSFRGSKSRNKVSVGEPAEGSLPIQLSNSNSFWIPCELYTTF